MNDLRLKGEFRGLLATNLIGPSPKFRAIRNGANKLTPNAPIELKVSVILLLPIVCSSQNLLEVHKVLLSCSDKVQTRV